jgi:DNA invertase Pin-like site-specific DNA recombinase
MGKNKNAVTLVRVSTKKQGGEDRFGMDAQRRSNERIVADQGFTVRKTIEYRDVSGDDVMFTAEMCDLQAYLHTPEMRGGNLVAKELSRILRPNYSDYPLLQVFEDQKISIHLPHYVLQLWTPEGRMLVGILCTVDFNEAQRIRERCMGGREESRRMGFCAAGGRTIPTGVTWDVKTKTWGYDSIYAPKIAEAFRMFASGETNFGHIIRTLHLCLRPSRGAPKLANPTALRRLLENRMFIGERVVNRKFDLSIPKNKLMYVGKDNLMHKRSRPLIAREPNESYVRQVLNPGLVSVEMFDKVQSMLRAKSDKTHQSHALHADRPKFCYRGLLFCADCGQPLYTVPQGDGYYRCRDHFPQRGGKRSCKSSTITRGRLEAELDRLFSQEFPRSYFFKEIFKKHVGSESRKEVARQRSLLMKEQKTLLEKRERIIEFALDGTIDRSDRDRRLKTVDDDLDSNRRKLTEVVDTPLPTYREWCDLLWAFKNFEDLPPDEKRRRITSRFQEIRVKDYRVVSLYLLTGEVATPNEPLREVDPNTCYSCGRTMRKRIPFGGVNYCEPCSEGIAIKEEQSNLAQPGSPDPAFTQGPSCDNTYQRL